jgi:anti-sigma-K factor RskA
MNVEEDRMARAGDYVLGLMSDEERGRAEHDVVHDEAFRDAVFAATQQLHRLDLTAAPDPVPGDLWARISRRIADLPQLDPSVERAAPHSGTRAVPVGPARPRSAFVWRSMAMAASLLAACGIGYLGALATASQPKPVVVVVLDTPANTPGAIFEAYADDSVRIVPLEDFVVPEGQTMEVWTLYDPAVGPVSLGTLGREAMEVTLKGPHLPAPKTDQLYEITLEPAPGSPTGTPTGPILVKGFARQPAGN